MTRLKITLFSLILGVLSVTACRPQMENLPLYSRTIAEVGTYEIKEDQLRFRFKLELDKFPKDFIEKYRKLPLNEENQLKPIFDQVFHKMIEDYSILTYGEKHNVKISDDELEQRFERKQKRLSKKDLESLLTEKEIPYHRWKNLVEDQIRVQYVMENMLGDDLKVSFGEIQTYYNKHRDEFKTTEEVHVRHIVTDSQDKANDILSRIQKGENFAQLAVNHSISPDRARGGDLGFYSKGTMPKVFDQAFTLKKGEISSIIKSEYGFHIFKLLDKRPAGYKEIKDVMQGIQQKLFEAKLKATYKTWMAKIKKEVPVTLEEENLKSFIL
jgi:parvulin-like peptidyl-prolyl isomerase